MLDDMEDLRWHCNYRAQERLASHWLFGSLILMLVSLLFGDSVVANILVLAAIAAQVMLWFLIGPMVTRAYRHDQVCPRRARTVGGVG